MVEGDVLVKSQPSPDFHLSEEQSPTFPPEARHEEVSRASLLSLLRRWSLDTVGHNTHALERRDPQTMQLGISNLSSHQEAACGRAGLQRDLSDESHQSQKAQVGLSYISRMSPKDVGKN
jgi:hypothetical protein